MRRKTNFEKIMDDISETGISSEDSPESSEIPSEIPPELLRIPSGVTSGEPEQVPSMRQYDEETQKELLISESKAKTVPRDGSVYWKVYKLEMKPGGRCDGKCHGEAN